ncbi:MAG: ABC transporter permease subunit [Paracoccaceae bacterium]
MAIIWPYAVAAPAVGLSFQFVLNPGTGILAYLNTAIPGFWDPSSSGTQAVISIILAGAWKQAAYSFVFFLAALQSTPRSLIEAAAMDGARPLRRVIDLQLPLLTPTLFFLLVINLTDSFTDSFGIVDTLTGGGPFRATELMVYRIYADGFRGFDYSGAAAQSIVLMMLVMGLTFVQFRYVERRVHYS